jgi:hypothetical protein
MSNLVAMSKDGQIIHVNPQMVEAHQKLGWQVVEKPEAQIEKPVKTTKK